MSQKDEFSPYLNEKAIVLLQDEDGNWRGIMQKFGKIIEVRGIGPETVLQMLLTNDGK